MNDLQMKVKCLSDINLQTFKDGIFLAYKDGITSIAPLGMSGNTVILYEAKEEKQSGRVSQVSLRNYCGSVELLITDVKGSFLFYGRYDYRIGLSFVAKEYFRVFNKVRKHIQKELPKMDLSKVEVNENYTKTIGFEMLESYQQMFWL